ncbi:MAG TPA: hypothetical protein VM242_13485 [Acidimicrobiales bacterium]|nr:hypothetical protein [Acidimicrobiales bacterium]
MAFQWNRRRCRRGRYGRVASLELLGCGAHLVEALPRHEFDEEHLPDALYLALKCLSPERAAVLDRARPVVVYCWDAR